MLIHFEISIFSLNFDPIKVEDVLPDLTNHFTKFCATKSSNSLILIYNINQHYNLMSSILLYHYHKIQYCHISF